MAMKSKFPGTCKDCGTTHVTYDMIDKNSNDNWCKNGKNCQGAMQLQSKPNTLESAPPLSLTEPTPEQLLETARELNKQSNEPMSEDTITKTYNEAAQAAVRQLVRQAGIGNIMDKAGIKHPSRVSFAHETMESIRG